MLCSNDGMTSVQMLTYHYRERVL